MVDLQSLTKTLNGEKEIEELQQIEPDFYRKVDEYMTILEKSREECKTLSAIHMVEDEIKGVRLKVEAIHDRRFSKISGLITATVEGSEVKTDNMIPTEKQMFESLLAIAERERRENLLKSLHIITDNEKSAN